MKRETEREPEREPNEIGGSYLTLSRCLNIDLYAMCTQDFVNIHLNAMYTVIHLYQSMFISYH